MEAHTSRDKVTGSLHVNSRSSSKFNFQSRAIAYEDCVKTCNIVNPLVTSNASIRVMLKLMMPLEARDSCAL